MKSKTVAAPIATSEGTFVARYTTRGLASLDFPSSGATGDECALSPQLRSWHKLTAAALDAALLGKSVKKLPPLDLSSATTFQREVWNTLRKIASGKTRSYSQVAQAIGRPAAVRAVGSACGANRIPVIIPCHRVLASNGGLGGFSGGLKWKRFLLEREGANHVKLQTPASE